jgi:acetyl esterase/lipase
VSDELFTTLDIYATFARLIGIEVPAVPGGKRDSLDLSPLLLGQADAKGRDVFWYYAGKELQAVRKGAWKLHVPHKYLTVAAEPGKGGKPSNWGKGNPKSIEESGIYGIASRHGYRVEEIGLALYDLSRDPGETSNVAEQNPGVVAELQAIVAQARADLGDEITKVVGQQVRPAGDVRPTLPSGTKVVSNQTYVVHKTGAVLLDLYLPSEKPAVSLPVVMWIHGGGWKSGAKEQCPLIFLAGEGYAVASINYRLVHEARWPAQIDDCRAAVRWLRENADKYGLDARRIAVAGGSAGGHLAALLGTLDLPSDEKTSSKIGAVIDFYGPSDLLTMPDNVPSIGKSDNDLATSNGARLLGGIIRDIPDRAKSASALYHVSRDDAPFLIIHGTEDKKVPLDQSQRLHDALQKAEIRSRLQLIDGAGHGGKAYETDEIKNMVRVFLREVLAP